MSDKQSETSPTEEQNTSTVAPRFAVRSRWPFYVGVAATIVITGLLWRSYSSNTDVERGLLALNDAYKQQRPGEARITDFDYAPPPATSRAASDNVDVVARDRAESLLREAAYRQGGPAALHALGRLYLTKRQYDEAIQALESAVASSPNDARLHSDLGAAFMERGNNPPLGESDGGMLADFARGLEHLNRALALDRSLPDALFNRGLVHQWMNVPRQAEDDWRRYLALDPKSAWADEVRNNFKRAEERRQVSKTAAEALLEFLDAYRARSDERAWKIMSQSREMITGKMVPLQLARGIVQAHVDGKAVEADELRDALKYAGALERTHSSDPFVAELANYYSKVGKTNRKPLADAHAEMSEGYRLCQASQYDDARTHFEHARSLFAGAGSGDEARLTDYWIAYCIAQRDRLEESAALLNDLVSFCKLRSYRWLLSQALCQLANAYDLLGDHSRSIALDRQSLQIATSISDTYNQQKVLTQLALQYTELGRPDHALEYHQRTLSLAADASTSPRQDWRNFIYTAQTFYRLKQYDAAASYESEALHLTLEELRDPALAHIAYTHLGMIVAGMQRYDEAVQLVNAGLDVARAVQNDSSSHKMMAYSLLQLGHIKRQANDCGAALQSYDEAIRMYEGMEIAKLDGYDAHKGRLLCYVNRGDNAATEAELARVLDLFEKDREEIAEEQNRNSFFDAESVYDIAIGYAYARGDQRRAFNYSEQSRARSLLDLLTHGVKSDAASGEVMMQATAAPLDATAVSAQLPAGIQVVQYAVLKDKLLIWFVSSTRFEVIERAVPAEQLNKLVLDYVALVSRNDESKSDEVRRRAEGLYDLLVAPVASLLDPAHEVCIVPDKALSHLPFVALVARATGHYLVQDFTVVFAPSASVFVHCSHTAKDRTQLPHEETLLSVGNPAFDRAVYWELPDLPAAEIEAKKVAQLYSGATALTGPNALKSTFMERLGRADVIHFAGHYVADERMPMRSRLLLAKDEALTAAEVFGKQLPQARLVVLSACETELERYDDGEGMIGIARTFLAAGAPLVVASQWPVDSDATADLMFRFHALRKLEGLSTTAALRRAQQEMLSGPGDHRNPYYWAAFLPVGGHAEY
jgi:CHAT domain-containing protein